MFIGQQAVIIKREADETFEAWIERVCERMHGRLDAAWKSGETWVAALADGRMVMSE